MKIAYFIFINFFWSCVVTAFPCAVYDWYSDPRLNTIIAPAPTNQIDHTAVSDGQGGAIVVWAQNIADINTEFDIYAQRIDSQGHPVWTAPLPVCTATGYQGLPKIVSDNAGGGIIAWHDSRIGFNDQYSNFDIYAQRISFDGRTLWTRDGMPVCRASNWQVFHKIVCDGQGGSFISWDDGRSGNSQVYAQHLDSNGTPMWTLDGVRVAETENGTSDSELAADGCGGLYLVYIDHRQLANMDVYAQHLDGAGNRLWPVEGLGIVTLDGDQFFARITSDGTGGAIIAWSDSRRGPDNFDIYAQHVNFDGNALWPPQGLPVCEENGSQTRLTMISDGIGGAIIAWEDGRKESNDTDIYMQRVTPDGTLVWNQAGVAVASSSEVQIQPAILSNGKGGAIIAWMDFYRGGTWWNIYAQHVNAEGQIVWTKDGIPISVADGTQSDPYLVTDGQGGAIIFWFDNRNSLYYNIYAQNVDYRGLLGSGEFRFYSISAIKGTPKNIFNRLQPILFRATWTNPAPEVPGIYEAMSAFSVNSGTDFRQKYITYEVVEDQNTIP
jgi:hypothetical protein